MAKYWMHRISHHMEVSRPFLKKGLLSIGFAGLAPNNKFLEAARNGDDKTFNEEFSKAFPALKNKSSLRNFLHFQKGDLVVVPGPKIFSVYEIVGEKTRPTQELDRNDIPEKNWNNQELFLNKQGEEPIKDHEKEMTDGLYAKNDKQQVTPIDLGFFWEVRPVVENVPRNPYAKSKLTSRLKARQTCLDIGDLEKEITESIACFKENKPIDLRVNLIAKTAGIWKKEILDSLNDVKFEQLVKSFLKKIGATEVVNHTKNESGKVGDVDVSATFENIKVIIDVQAKFHQGETSEWAVEQIHKFSESISDDDYCRVPWVITSADDYSDAAKHLAEEKGVRLIDGNEFVQMLMDAGLDGLNMKEL